MPKGPGGLCRAFYAALLAAIVCIQPVAAPAQAVNFDLLIESLEERARPGKTAHPVRHPPAREQVELSKPAEKLDPIQELVEYVQCLRNGRCRFLPGQTGEEAAMDLGYSRLFASAYDEVVLRTKVREDGQTRPEAADIIDEFEAIVREERTIDQLMTRGERHAAAIAYLRALQNGDVVFPGPRALAPVPQVLLLQLMNVYDVSFSVNDFVFATIYRQTREFAAARILATQEVWTQEIIGEFRRLIVQSATVPEATASMCEMGAAAGELAALMKVCPQLRLSPAASKQMTSERMSDDCKTKAAARLKATLSSMPGDSIRQLCGSVARDVRGGKKTVLEIWK